MSKFLTLLNKVLNEQLGGNQEGPVEGELSPIDQNINDKPEPVEVSDSSSALPDEKDVNNIDLIAYKDLLKTLKDSAVRLAVNDIERSQIADLDIDSKTTKEELQPIKDALIATIYKNENPKNSDDN